MSPLNTEISNLVAAESVKKCELKAVHVLKENYDHTFSYEMLKYREALLEEELRQLNLRILELKVYLSDEN